MNVFAGCLCVNCVTAAYSKPKFHFRSERTRQLSIAPDQWRFVTYTHRMASGGEHLTRTGVQQMRAERNAVGE
jgi:hypothetical protein